MAQIVQGPRGIAESLGTGIGSGLQYLAENKLQQLAQQRQSQQQSSGLASLLEMRGVSKDKANQVASSLYQLSPEERKPLLENLDELLSGQIGAPQQLHQIQQPAQQEQPQGQDPEMVLGAIAQMIGKSPSEAAQEIMTNPELQQLFKDAVGMENIQKLVGQQGQQQPAPQAGPAQKPIGSLFTSPAKKAQQEALGLKKETLDLRKQEAARHEKAEAFKQTKAERKEIIDKAKAARQNLHDLERLEELEKEGKLDTPGYVEFLKRSGLDLPALMNEGSEEFQKIAANFIRDAKSVFGARVSNFEIEQFLKTIPSLSQSPEGRKRVIANLKKVARGNLEYSNALKDVISENKGIPPLDLLEKVEDKVEKKLEKLSQKFKEDLAKPVPKAQNQLITALQSSLGTLAGNIPSALKGAAKGAVGGATVGAFGGPIGATTGGILGGLGGLTGLI